PRALPLSLRQTRPLDGPALDLPREHRRPPSPRARWLSNCRTARTYRLHDLRATGRPLARHDCRRATTALNWADYRLVADMTSRSASRSSPVDDTCRYKVWRLIPSSWHSAPTLVPFLPRLDHQSSFTELLAHITHKLPNAGSIGLQSGLLHLLLYRGHSSRFRSVERNLPLFAILHFCHLLSSIAMERTTCSTCNRRPRAGGLAECSTSVAKTLILQRNTDGQCCLRSCPR